MMQRLALGLRRPGSLANTLKQTSELRKLVGAAARQARRVLGHAKKRAGRAGKRGQLATAGLAREIELADRVAEQTRRRLAGETNIADRLVSLCDLEARPFVAAAFESPPSSATSWRWRTRQKAS